MNSKMKSYAKAGPSALGRGSRIGFVLLSLVIISGAVLLVRRFNSDEVPAEATHAEPVPASPSVARPTESHRRVETSVETSVETLRPGSPGIVVDVEDVPRVSSVPGVSADRTLPELLKLVQTGDTRLEDEAFRMICRLPNDEAKAAAIWKILSMYEGAPRRDAWMQAFASVNDPSMSEALIKMMGTTTDDGFKQWVQNLLMNMEGGATVQALDRVARESTDDVSVESARATLAGMEAPSALPALESVLVSDADPSLIRAAALGIAHVGNPEALDILWINARNKTAISEPSIAALATVSSPYGRQALFNILQNETDTQIRLSAATALSRQADTETERMLRRVSHSESDLAVQQVILNSINSADRSPGYDYSNAPNENELIETIRDDRAST